MKINENVIEGQLNGKYIAQKNNFMKKDKGLRQNNKLAINNNKTRQERVRERRGKRARSNLQKIKYKKLLEAFNC